MSDRSNTTHRKTIARGVAARTGETYQQALTRVVAADEAGALPTPLDAAGRAAAVEALTAQHAGPTPPAPTTPTPTAAVDQLEVAAALHNVADLVSIGATLIDAVETAAATSPDPVVSAEFVRVAQRLLEQDAAGSGSGLAPRRDTRERRVGLAAALAEAPHVFTPVVVKLVEVGALNGNQNQAVRRAAEGLEREAALDRHRKLTAWPPR